jgi:hypothetical protein
MRWEIRRTTIRLVLALAVALALTACTQVDENSSGLQSQESRATGQSFDGFLACMQQVAYDYEPADTPAHLARQADAVVTGTIVDMKPGQSYAPTPDDRANATFVLEVKVDQVLAGDPEVVADGSVYVEMPNPTSGERCLRNPVPRAYGVFFLDDRTSQSYSGTILHEGAGRPAGARITAPFVQGFLIEDARGKLVSVKDSLETMPPAWRDLDSVDEVLAGLD